MPSSTNETLNLLYNRASVRSYKDGPIPPDVLRQVLEAGCHAASGGNLQPVSIIKIEDPAVRRRVAELCEDQRFIAQAPVDLLFCLDQRRLKRWAALAGAPFTADRSFRHFWVALQDTVICAQSVCTAADAVGLGSCYVASVLECFPELVELFALPAGVFPVVLLTLGWPKARPKPARKLGVEVIVHDGRYHDPADDDLLAAMDAKYPGYRLAATEERRREIERVCRAAHGEEFAGSVLGRIAEAGFINRAQHYFGLNYRADEMPRGNQDFIKVIAESGLRPFEEFEPGEA